MQLFNERQEAFINMEVVQKLATMHGPVRCDGGEFVFHNGRKATSEEVAAARKLAISDINRNDVRSERARRILLVMRNIETQLNMLLWLVGPNKKTPQDKALAGSIIDWIMSTNKVGNQLVDANYRDDKFWPKPPDGAAKFMEQFQ